MKVNLMYADWILIIVGIVSVLLLGVLICLSRMNETAFGVSDNGRLKDAVKVRNTWLASSITFLFAHYWCILFSILATIIVLYLSCFEEMNNIIRIRIMLYSALSLFTNMLPYVVRLDKIAKKYRMAYINILKEILGEDTISKAIINGENEIYNGFDD